MLREINIRGYAKYKMINSQWLYGFGVKDVDYVDGTIEYHLHTFSGVYEVVPESIGQYTGLQDKHGKEIFEGDVYHMGNPNFTYTVVWYDTGLKGKQNGSSSSYAGLEHWSERIEIIGNRYQNPELLEEL